MVRLHYQERDQAMKTFTSTKRSQVTFGKEVLTSWRAPRRED
jgi:hypothetical protein